MKRGFARFWYRFKNWFRTKEGPGEPLRFLCGSEEELRRVTTWMCHVRSDVFRNGSEVRVCYTAQMENARKQTVGVGFLEGVVFDDGWPPSLHSIPDVEVEYSRQWCAWVFKHNTFEGSQWFGGDYLFTVVSYKRDGSKSEWGPTIPGTRSEAPLDIYVSVHPPSAHERAEALLALSEWLDGKVSEQEKRELLQLPDDVEV